MFYGKLAATADTSVAKYWFDLPVSLENEIKSYLKILIDTETNPIVHTMLSDRVDDHFREEQLESGFIALKYDDDIVYFRSFCKTWRIYSESANANTIRQLAIKEMIYSDLETLQVQ